MNSNVLAIGGTALAAGGDGTLTVGVGGHVDAGMLLGVWEPGRLAMNGGTLAAQALNARGAIHFNGGTVTVANDALFETDGIANLQSSLTTGSTLEVGGLTTFSGAYTLSLDGGTFSTGMLGAPATFAFNSGTFALTGEDLIIGPGGHFGSSLELNSGKTVEVTQNAVIDENALLALAGGRFSAATTLNDGHVNLDGVTSELGGGTFENNGLVDGNGRISATLANAASGEVGVLIGDALRFTGVGNTNAGEISNAGGTVRFDHDLMNTSDGTLGGRGVFRIDGGLDNHGTLGFSGGFSDVHGDVNNTAGGSVIVSGGATATFFDDVVHNGSLFRVSNGANVVIFGAVSGAGAFTGTGDLFFEGEVNPGNSPALMTVQGDLTFGFDSTVNIELGGLVRGSEYDAFDVGQTVTLNGALVVERFDLGGGLFDPVIGDSFDLFRAEAIDGDFITKTYAALGAGKSWQLELLPDAIGDIDVLRLSVVAVPLPPALWLFAAGVSSLARYRRINRIG